jgi:branched-chain amino acid aminotransferase
VAPPLTTSLVSVNGEITVAPDGLIAATEEQLSRGDGAFEVIAVYDGRPFALRRHLLRLQRSASKLGVAVDVEAVAAEAKRLLAQAGAGGSDRELLRIALTGGGQRLLLTEPLPPTPARIRLASVTYAPTPVPGGGKSLSYAANLAAGRLAGERGFDGALLVSPSGSALGASTGDLFWVDGEEVLTPPLDDQIFTSITRAAVIELVGARERACKPLELAHADEVFLCSTAREVQPVAAVDAHPLLDGPVTAEAAAALSKLIRSELAADSEL